MPVIVCAVIAMVAAVAGVATPVVLPDKQSASFGTPKIPMKKFFFKVALILRLNKEHLAHCQC